MFELFSDFVAAQSSPLARVDPRLRLIIAGALLAAVIFSTHLPLPIAVFGCCLVLLLALRVPLKLILLRLGSPAALVAVLVVVQAFSGTGAPLATYTFFGREFVVTDDGLWRGALLFARVLGAVAVMVVLSFSTPAHEIFQSLRWLRFPAAWVEIAMLMYRYIFMLLDEASDVAVAQRVRLGYATLPRTLSSLGTLAGTVVVRSYDQSLRTHEAMTLRGYTGTLPVGPMPAVRAGTWALILLTPLLIAACFCLNEWPAQIAELLGAHR